MNGLDLAALIVVSAAEGIGTNVPEELFNDRLTEEAATLLTLYLTGNRASTKAVD